MDIVLFVAWLGAFWWSVAFAVLLFTSAGALLQPWLQARRAVNRGMPPISVILPIKLHNPGFEEAQGSIFTQTYPAYEVLFSAAEASSPVLDLAQSLTRAHPDRSSRIMQSHCDAAVSPKLNTLAAPLAAAAHDVILTQN